MSLSLPLSSRREIYICVYVYKYTYIYIYIYRMRLCRCSHVAFARRARTVCVRGFHHSLPTCRSRPRPGPGWTLTFFWGGCSRVSVARRARAVCVTRGDYRILFSRISYKHTCKHTSVHAYIYIYTYSRIHIYIYIHTYIYIYLHI